MITFLCGKCGKRLQVADEVAGKKCRCPSCTTVNNVPNSVPSGGTSSNPSSQQNSLDDLFPSSTSSSSSATSGAPSSAGGLWDSLDSQSSSSRGQAPNPYAVNPHPPTPQANYGSTSYTPQYGAGYVPDASPLGMIFGILSVCMPLFICFYGLSIPIGLMLGIAAWIISSNERRKAAQGIVRIGLADVGYILGIIGTVINGILLLIVASFIIFVIVAAARANQL